MTYVVLQGVKEEKPYLVDLHCQEVFTYLMTLTYVGVEVSPI